MAVVCVLSGRAHSAEGRTRTQVDDPMDSLRRTSQTLGDVLRRRLPDWSPEAEASRGRVDAILAGMLDYEEIARRALSTEWDKLPGEQRREFLETFSALTNRAFVAAMKRSDVHLKFDSETIEGQSASVVVTACASKAPPVVEERMEYRLARRHDRWMVCDVLVDGISLVDGYRDQFARLIRRGGFRELLERMRHKLQTSQGY